MTYQEFLQSKVPPSHDSGFDVLPGEVHELLKPHQRDIVCWAVKKGRAAIFAAFGLGKSLMQLECARLVLQKVSESHRQEDLFPFCRFLIVAPLGVRQEFKRDAAMIKLDIKFVRRIEECGETGIYLTNYETIRDGKLDPRQFTGVSLDEAGILRGFGGTKTFRKFMQLFEGTSIYRFVATATPSPNEFIELLAYAGFLDVMDIGQAKTRFFKRDSTKADALTLHPHKEREFWLWVSTWAIFLQKPSDLGHDDAGYDLPEVEIHWHEIPSNYEQSGFESNGQGRLVNNSAIGVTHAAREKRSSLAARVQKLMAIIGDMDVPTGMESEVLRRESGGGEEALSEVLSRDRKEKHRPGKEESLHGRIPEDICQERALAGEHRSIPKKAQRKISHGPRISGALSEEGQGSESGKEEGISYQEGLRPNSDSGGESTSQAGGRLCDLRDNSLWHKGTGQEGAISRGGSRPQNGTSEGNPLSELQLWDRAVQRQSGCASTGDSLPQFIVWCELNDEQRAVDRCLTDSRISFSSIYGNDPEEEREDKLASWLNKDAKAFVTKPVMYGAGVNLQQCNVAIFMGLSFKFSEFIQAVKRIHRFLQKRKAIIHLIYTEAEREIRRTLERKWAQHVELVGQMTAIIRQYGLASSAVQAELRRSFGVQREEERGESFCVVHNDSVIEAPLMPSDYAGLILTSIPFSTQYEYSPSFNDFGHCDDNPHFFRQFDFFTPELFRILKPGRVAAIHVKDRITPGGMTGLGFQTVYPFHCDTIAHFQKHGFAYLGMKTIVTDVVRENNQTYRLGWTEQCKDGSRMGVGMPEYLLLFRKPPTDSSNGYADIPVVKDKEQYSRSRWQIDAHGFMRSSGNRLLMSSDLVNLPHEKIFKLFREFSKTQTYDFEQHVALGEALEVARRLPVTFMLLQPQSWHPDVWTDITRMLTLNGAQSAAGREMHLCPMQFDLADRVIAQFSMKGEVVFDPFAGLGTVPLRAVKLGRFGHGIELSGPYYQESIRYLQAAETKARTPTLFDMDVLEEQMAEEIG